MNNARDENVVGTTWQQEVTVSSKILPFLH